MLGRSMEMARSQWEGKHPEPKSRVDERKVVATVKLLGHGIDVGGFASLKDGAPMDTTKNSPKNTR